MSFVRDLMLEAIDSYVIAKGISADKFSRLAAAGDHHFYRNLATGKNVMLSRLEAVENYMIENPVTADVD